MIEIQKNIMNKTINKAYKIYVTNITIGKVYSNGGIDAQLRGHENGWKIQSLVLPPCENIEVDLWAYGRTQNHLTTVLRYVRKVIYLATDPRIRELVYFSNYDHDSRRKLSIEHHKLGIDNEDSLCRLIQLEKHIMNLLKFYSDEEIRDFEKDNNLSEVEDLVMENTPSNSRFDYQNINSLNWQKVRVKDIYSLKAAQY